MQLSEIHAAFRRYYAIEDTDYIDVALSVTLSSHTGLPLWLIVIGASGQGKTSVLSPLFTLEKPKVHELSDLTANTFLSGQLSGKSVDPNASLLNRLGPRFTLIAKDLSTLLTKHPNTRAEIIDQLRHIADGHHSKDVGVVGGSVEWRGHAAFLGAVTLEIDDYRQEFGSLGERFINFRLVDPPLLQVKSKLDDQLTFGGVKNADLQALVATFMSQTLSSPQRLSDIAIPPEIDMGILALSQLVAICRALAPIDKVTKDVFRITRPESFTRLYLALKHLARLLARLRNHSSLTADEWRTVRRVAMDTIPEPMRTILGALQLDANPQRINTIAAICHLPRTTISRYLARMAAVQDGAVTETEGADGNGVQIAYTLSDRACSLLDTAPKILDFAPVHQTREGMKEDPLYPLFGGQLKTQELALPTAWADECLAEAEWDDPEPPEPDDSDPWDDCN